MLQVSSILKKKGKKRLLVDEFKETSDEGYIEMLVIFPSSPSSRFEDGGSDSVPIFFCFWS